VNGDGGAADRRHEPTGYLDYLEEDDALLDARERSVDFGCPPIEPIQGAALRFLATTLRARAVVEIGTGVGVSGLWLLRGMAGDGVLTSIEIEPELLREARAGFLGAGYPSSRFRLIGGMALDVLPRLTDGAYDLVFVDGVTVEYPKYFQEATRLLRPGGVVALTGVSDPDVGPRPVRGAEAGALREVLRLAFETPALVPLPLPLGDGLLVVTKSPS
jgi:predicted O-methyltransferase YrrM